MFRSLQTNKNIKIFYFFEKINENRLLFYVFHNFFFRTRFRNQNMETHEIV